MKILKASRIARKIMDTKRRWTARRNLSTLSQIQNPNFKSIFIDCGAYDGCSAVKFILANPNFDCISFEPNPELWHYFENVPTTLVKAGVASSDKTADFIVDHIDGDGSTMLKGKRVIYGGRSDNSDCKIISIKCRSLGDILKKIKDRYQTIVLKLDVEGAEYEIFDNLLESRDIRMLSKIYCEFHWQKCGITYERHKELLDSLRSHCEVLEWDAADFAIHKKTDARGEWRDKLISQRLGDVRPYKMIQL